MSHHLAVSASQHASSISGAVYTLRGSSNDTNFPSRSSARDLSCHDEGACHASGEGVPARASTRSDVAAKAEGWRDSTARAEGWRDSTAKASPRRVVAELSPPGLAGDVALEIEIEGEIELELPAGLARGPSSGGSRKNKSPHGSTVTATASRGSLGGASGLLPYRVAQHPLVASLRRSFSSSSSSSLAAVRPLEAGEDSHSPLVQKEQPTAEAAARQDGGQDMEHCMERSVEHSVEHGRVGGQGGQSQELGGELPIVIVRV